jgi:hypothetical protein
MGGFYFHGHVDGGESNDTPGNGITDIIRYHLLTPSCWNGEKVLHFLKEKKNGERKEECVRDENKTQKSLLSRSFAPDQRGCVGYLPV